MLIGILTAAGIAAGLVLLCWLLRGVLLTPVKPGRTVQIRILLTVSGAAPSLEQTVDALSWLRANGTLPGEIVLTDAGMDRDTAEIAAALERSGVITITD